MSKLMLIDAAHAEETRVTIADGTRIEEFDFESAAKRQLRGNIYLAKVTRVEPSLQAAFIEYGGNRHGFLAFNEIHPDYYQIPLADREALMRDLADDSDAHHDVAPKAGAREEGDEGDDDEHHVEEAGVSDEEDVMEQEVERRRRKLLRRYKIQEVIKRRQIMLVQVVKEERGNKGAALTTYLSLAGRYGVLMPNTARGGGISRKIVAAADRKKLKTIVHGLDVPAGMGLIIRTAGAKRTKTEIQRDYDYLMRAWESIRETTMHSIAPAQIYAEEDLVKRAIRDMYDKDIEAVIVEGDQAFKDARDMMRMLMPAQAKKVQHHRDAAPLFVKYRVEDQLSQIYSPVVPLRSGGYLVINQTEALVAIDVNSGRATRERNIEATALKTNMEAAEEACRQLRLRDLAGLIVIDFIDMDEAKNNRAVEKKVKDGLAEDRARVQMGRISMFGLMEISRQRRRTGVLEGTTHVCEHCGGSGRVRTVESAALSALRAVEVEAAKGGAGAVTLRVPRSVGLYILNEKRGWLETLNQTTGLFVTVLIDDQVKEAEHAIDRTSHSEGFVRPAESRILIDDDDDDYVDVEDTDEEEEAEEESEGGGVREDVEDFRPAREADGEGRRGRGRRRRRGGRGRDDEAPRVERADGAESAEDEDDDSDEDGEGGEGPRADHADDAEGRAGRRRRRGRRGGRRTREEGRPDDPYSWARMRAPDGDPYVWLDPADVLGGGAPQTQAAQPQSAPPERAEVLVQQGDTDIWVELPAKEDTGGRPGRNRRGRGRDRDRDRTPRESAPDLAQDNDETPHVIGALAPEPEPIAAPATVAPEAPTEPAAKPKRASRAKKVVEPVAEAEAAVPTPVVEATAPEPVVEAKPKPARAKAAPKAAAPVVAVAPVAPVVPAEPDPAEISGPPPAAKRGWWRR
jgi:ribonuclease E